VDQKRLSRSHVADTSATGIGSERRLDSDFVIWLRGAATAIDPEPVDAAIAAPDEQHPVLVFSGHGPNPSAVGRSFVTGKLLEAEAEALRPNAVDAADALALGRLQGCPLPAGNETVESFGVRLLSDSRTPASGLPDLGIGNPGSGVDRDAS
jgi:hypothetical protein